MTTSAPGLWPGPSSARLWVWLGVFLLQTQARNISVDAFIPARSASASLANNNLVPNGGVGATFSSSKCSVAFDASHYRHHPTKCAKRTNSAIVCNVNVSSSSQTQTSIIETYKSLPDVDDGLGPLDFGITDSLSVPNELRPTLLETLSNPRDIFAMILLLFGGCSVAYHNILGIYGPTYELAQRASICLGFLTVIATIVQLSTSYLIATRPRMGVVDDAALTAYAGLYSGAASWLALRTCDFCPDWLTSLDGVSSWLAVGVFAYSLAAPSITLYDHYFNGGDDNGNNLSTKMVRASRILSPTQQNNDAIMSVPAKLSETELVRTKGMLFIGILGCIFVPDCLEFAFQGQEWWSRVIHLHPKQTLLESGGALFALFATEASMVATRTAKAGVAPYRKVVPVFGGVCLLLALVPCGCSLWWLGGGDDISFLSFYSE